MPLKKLAISLAIAATTAAGLAPAAHAAPTFASLSSGSSASELEAIGDALKELEGVADSGIPAAPGTQTRHQVTVPGQPARSYILQTPAGYSPDKTYDIVYGFGGMGHSASRAESYMSLSSTLGTETLVVYPEPTTGRNGELAWEGPNYASTTRGQDVAFVRAIDKQLRSQHRIDASYGTGLSNGGGMALSVACQASELFSAVAVVASANYDRVFEGCSGSVPTLMIHGTEDPVAPYGGPDHGSNAHGGGYLSARAAFATIANRNQCDASAPAVTPGAAYDALRKQGCTAETTMYRVNGGGHTWFNGDGAQPDATAKVSAFFRAHP